MDRGRVVLECGPDGLRAKEFGVAAGQVYWDDLWARAGIDYSRSLSGHLPRQLRLTVRRHVAAPARVLEAGCGLGHFTVAMHELGYDAVGVDWAQRTLDQLKERFPDIDFSCQDVRATTFPDASFDAVYSPGVCEHFEEGPDAILAEAYRLLRPGGFAFVSTPYLNPLRQRRWRSGGGPGPDDQFYQYVFPAETMCTTLRRIGYEIVNVRPYGAWSATAMELPVLKRFPLGRLAGAADVLSITSRFGSTCIWSARRPE
jgi:SAM-dependent methyltransferase